jgi:hypothetical protein
VPNRPYVIIAGSAAEKFHNSRAKIRLYGGGFGNGKTTGLVADTLKVIRDYPGCNVLLGRATFPKLNSTLRREFFKWCPSTWIKSGNKNENTWQFVNDSVVDFRYVAQKLTGEAGSTSSNLLSASYDYIGIDQIEDPEIEYNDFLQLLGRLRGSTPYAGTDPTMPATGPRMMVLTANPSLGWVYEKLVRPLHDWQRGIDNPNLLCELDANDRPIIRDGRKVPIIEVFEASTLDNAQNLPPDYIKTLLATYKGRFRERYVYGKWVAFEGIVYNEFDPVQHVVPLAWLRDYVEDMRMFGYTPTVVESYDFGIAEPSCYLLGLVDQQGRVLVVDGFYESNMSIHEQADTIKSLRKKHNVLPQEAIRADRACFRRTNATMQGNAKSVSAMFAEYDIDMQPAPNALIPGIVQVKQYLDLQMRVVHPFLQSLGCPNIFFADHLQFITNEATTYRWKQRSNDEQVDEPVDKDNHAMDALRYMLSMPIKPAHATRAHKAHVPDSVRKWHEQPLMPNSIAAREHRYLT